MTARTVAMAVAVLLTACGHDASNPLGEGPTGAGANRAPQIASIVVEPATIDPGQTATVTVVATDPDGDGVTFEYRASSGTITRDNTVLGRAYYTHDGSATVLDTVVVTVSDGRATATASREVTIRPRVETTPSAPPTVPPTTPPPTGSVSVEVTASPESCHPQPGKPCTVTCTASANASGVQFVWSGCASGTGSTAICSVTAPGTTSCGAATTNTSAEIVASATVTGTNQGASCAGLSDPSWPGMRHGSYYGTAFSGVDPDGDPVDF